MSSSLSRRQRRLALQPKFTIGEGVGTTLANGGGFGDGNKVSRPATGNTPGQNPFMIPKRSGLNIITQSFPDNYFVEWNLSSWRAACDQAQKMGWPISYATLTAWAFEASTFIQSLFVTYGDGVSKIPFYLVDKDGNRDEIWTNEVCNTRWFRDLVKEIVWSNFWGFSGINIDPINNRIYKYPMQQIDPINRMLRESTYNFTDGMDFAKSANLIFLQPSTSYERFLGWMQPITREFIQMNLNSLNWVQAGRRLAFPLLAIGYPANSQSITDESNLVSPFRIEAENYAANLDPSKTLLSPYIIDRDGKKVSALEIESKDTSGKQNAHKIYQEFNTDQKNDIRELVFGGTLTSNAGKFGTKGLGQVHENKLKTALEARIEEVLSVLNDENDFRNKITVFYKNFPDDLRFDTNRTKEWNIDEIGSLSKSAQESGLKLTSKFFIKFGLDQEDIEEAPQEVPTGNSKPVGEEDSETLAVKFDKPKKSIFGLKKKY